MEEETAALVVAGWEAAESVVVAAVAVVLEVLEIPAVLAVWMAAAALATGQALWFRRAS